MHPCQVKSKYFQTDCTKNVSKDYLIMIELGAMPNCLNKYS